MPKYVTGPGPIPLNGMGPGSVTLTSK